MKSKLMEPQQAAARRVMDSPLFFDTVHHERMVRHYAQRREDDGLSPLYFHSIRPGFPFFEQEYCIFVGFHSFSAPSHYFPIETQRPETHSTGHSFHFILRGRLASPLDSFRHSSLSILNGHTLFIFFWKF